MPLHIVNHPLVHDALMELRDVRTDPPAFRRAANRISGMLAAEALREVPAAAATVMTPLGPADGLVVRVDVVVVPVLRAGLGMDLIFVTTLAVRTILTGLTVALATPERERDRANTS